MATTSNLLTAVEAALLGPSPPTPAQRLELLHALRAAQPALKTFLSHPVRALTGSLFIYLFFVFVLVELGLGLRFAASDGIGQSAAPIEGSAASRLGAHLSGQPGRANCEFKSRLLAAF